MNRAATIHADLRANDAALTEAIDGAILFSKRLGPLLAALRTPDDCELGRVFRALVEGELAEIAQDTVLFDSTPAVTPPLALCSITGDPS